MMKTNRKVEWNGTRHLPCHAAVLHHVYTGDGVVVIEALLEGLKIFFIYLYTFFSKFSFEELLICSLSHPE
jgi:hypothetical protein